MNEQEKIIYVYEYVAGHDYDKLFTYSDSNQSAYSFFTKGTSVCAGFAKASQIIFQNIGINSYLVMNDDHMWNYVEYQGEYYVFDATVGASYVNKKHKNFYEGLGRTTVGENTGMFSNLYPKINDKPLKEIFGL
jgi:transglutaminase/protease-like cytokinesis protein 3